MWLLRRKTETAPIEPERTEGPIADTSPEMALTVVPRLEHISYSLYWKEPLHITTEKLPDVQLKLGTDVELGDRTREEILAAAAKHLGWAPVDSLLRLEGWNDPWERLIYKGREVNGPISSANIKPGDKIVVVRRILKADGWRVKIADDFLSDEEEEEDN